MNGIDIVYHADSNTMELKDAPDDLLIGTDGDDYATYLRFQIIDDEGILDGFSPYVLFEVESRPMIGLDESYTLNLTQDLLNKARYGKLPFMLVFKGKDSTIEIHSTNTLTLGIAHSIDADREVKDDTPDSELAIKYVEITYHAESRLMELTDMPDDQFVGTDGDDYATYLRFTMDDPYGLLAGYSARVEFDVSIKDENGDTYKPFIVIDESMSVPLIQRILSNVKYGAIPIQMAFKGNDSEGRSSQFYSLNKLRLSISDSIRAIEGIDVDDRVDLNSVINNVEYNPKTATFSFRQIDGGKIAIQLSDLSEEHFEVPSKDDLKKLNKAQNGDTATTLDDGKWYKLYGAYDDIQSWKVMSPSVKAVDDHISDRSNPHNVTKTQLGLENVDNTSDINKPISTATQNALNDKASKSDVDVVNDALTTHKTDTSNPHGVNKSQLGLGNVDNTSDVNKPISTATQEALDGKASTSDLESTTNVLNEHVANLLNPHNVTKTQLGLENVDNTSDINKPISTATQNALDGKASTSDLESTTKKIDDHIKDTDNPHNVTKTQLGLGNVDNTSDMDKPISTAVQKALDDKASKSELTPLNTAITNEITNREQGDKTLNQTISDHTANTSNPHNVTKTQLGLENVDNTSDMDKPISTAVQKALDDKASKSDLSKIYRPCGSVNTFDELPTNPQIGDVYDVASDGMNYAWVEIDGVPQWDELGSIGDNVDMSNYYTKGEVDTKVSNYLPLDGGTLSGTLSIKGTTTFGSNVFMDGTGTPLIIGNKGKIGLRAKGNSIGNAGQINISDSWYGGNQTQWGAQISAYDSVANEYNQLRVSHEGLQYIVYDNATATESSESVALLSDIPDISGLATKGEIPSIDSSLSSTSTNPVQNKAIQSELSKKQNNLVAGSNISIATDGVTISATDTTYGVASTTANGLMSKDDKSKLDGISAGAQVNSITGVKGNAESTYRTGNVNITPANIGLGNVNNTSDANKPISTATQNALNGKQATIKAGSNISIATDGVTISATDTTYSVVTDSANGLMSSAMLEKLNGISAGANKTTVDSSLNDTSTNPVQNKVITSEFGKYLPLAGGTMAGEIRVNGGDQAGASKIVLETGVGQITNSGTQTLFGFTSTNAISCGHGSYAMNLRGNGSRPTYNNNNMAMLSDLDGKANSSHTHTEYLPLTGGKVTGSVSFTGQIGNTQSEAGVYLGLDANVSSPNANIAIVSAYTASYIDMGTPDEDYGFRIIKWSGLNDNLAQFCYPDAKITIPRANGTMALRSDIPNVSGFETKANAITGLSVSGKTITYTKGNGATGTITTQDTTYSTVTAGGSAGLMSGEDKTKLDSIVTGANKTTVDSSLNDTSTNPVQNKVIKSALDGKANSSHTHSEYLPLAGGTMSGSLDFNSTTAWITPYLLAFKNDDVSQNPTYPYTGFYQRGSQWQVNARDSNNTYVHNLLNIDNETKIATFGARPTVEGLGDLALKSEIPTYTSGTGISVNGTTINHSNSVTAQTTYVGSATAVPRIQYDAQGHITACTTATIYPPTTVGTAGQIWQSDGSDAGIWQTLDTVPTANSTNAVTSGGVKTALDGKLPNYVNTIGMTNGGNPRQVKFISVNYNTVATYFKMSAMCCHDNGVSYQFLEDIIIGVTTTGTVTCNVYKYCQQSCGTASYNLVDGLERYYGDVFYTIDTTNKIVDFYVLIGQYSVSQYTPPTKIGNTSIAYVTPMTGGAVYHSSGTRVWANGNGATYVTTKDVPTITKSTADPSGGKDGDIWFKYE